MASIESEVLKAFFDRLQVTQSVSDTTLADLKSELETDALPTAARLAEILSATEGGATG